MSIRGRLENCTNQHQGTTKKVLCVCSAGLLRSPTAAQILSAHPFNFNTRSVGANPEYALIPLDIVHVKWADEIICFSYEHKEIIETLLEELPNDPWGDVERVIHFIETEDCHAYMAPKLIEHLFAAFKEIYEIKNT